MQFMMIVKGGCEGGKKPSAELIAAVLHYTQELRKAGVLVELSRLEPSSKGVRMKFTGGQAVVTDGPFAETKELVGGYWIIQVNSKEEAIAWAKRVPALNGEWEPEIEIRQFLEVEEYVPSAALNAAAEPARELAKSRTNVQ
jgi:hypothetical protein